MSERDWYNGFEEGHSKGEESERLLIIDYLKRWLEDNQEKTGLTATAFKTVLVAVICDIENNEHK